MCIMLDTFCCTYVKPWNLPLKMRQLCIVWSVVWYIFAICIYHILSYTQYVQDIFLNNTLLNQYPWIYVLMLSQLTQERSSTVNVYTRSYIKEHKVVPECWQLSKSEPHLRKIYALSTSTLAKRYLDLNLLPSSVASITFFWG